MEELDSIIEATRTIEPAFRVTPVDELPHSEKGARVPAYRLAIQAVVLDNSASKAFKIEIAGKSKKTMMFSLRDKCVQWNHANPYARFELDVHERKNVVYIEKKPRKVL